MCHLNLSLTRIYNTISESPEHYNNVGLSEAGALGDGSPSPNLKLQPDLVKKALKKSSTVPLPSSGKRPSANKESKNKLGLRLNIPKADEKVKFKTLKFWFKFRIESSRK